MKVIITILLLIFLISCSSILENDNLLKKDKIPYISIVFYDATKNTYNSIQLLNSYKFQATAGIVVSKVGNENYMSWNDLISLQNNYHWEIASQTYLGNDLEQVYNEELIQELDKSYSELIDHNLDINTIVIPNGHISVRQEPIVNDFYQNILLSGIDGINSNPLLRTNLWSFQLKSTTTMEDIIERLRLSKINNEKILIFIINKIEYLPQNEEDISLDLFNNLLKFLSDNNYHVYSLSTAINKALDGLNYE